MRIDQRQTVYLGYSLLYPKLDRLDRNQGAELYALIHDMYPLEACTHHGDEGVTFETEDWISVEVTREMFQYSERVRADLSEVKMRAANIFDLTLANLQIPVFVVQRVVLRQIWPDPAGGSLPQRMRGTALQLTDPQYAILGDDVGAGIHLVGETTSEPEFHWHLELDPAHADQSTLYVQLVANFGEPHTEIAGLTECLTAAIDFMSDNVSRFIAEILPDTDENPPESEPDDPPENGAQNG